MSVLNYKAIFLDIDDTIYDYTYAHEMGMKAVLLETKKYGIEESKFLEIYKISRNKIHVQLEGTGSSHSRLLYFQNLLEYVNLNFSDAINLDKIYWDEFLNHMKFRKNFLEFWEKIKTKKIVFVTDLTTEIQIRKIKKLGLNIKNTFLVTSEEAGHEKPHPFMFQLALNKVQLTPKDVCMIGDNFEKDILGAQFMGIDSYWLTNEKETHVNIFTFQSFLEIF